MKIVSLNLELGFGLADSPLRGEPAGSRESETAFSLESICLLAAVSAARCRSPRP
jgi:hypothetical protein